MRLCAIIPARGGSKGIPKKNIKELNGLPLISYTITAALKSEIFDKILVSTDCTQIGSYCTNLGAEVPFLRPSHLASDSAKSIDVIEHVLDFLETKQSYVPDIFVLLQPTSPLRTSEDILGAYKLFNKKEAKSLVSVTSVPHNFNPESLYTKSDHNLIPMVSVNKVFSRQYKTSYYARNGAAIYMVNTSWFKRKKVLFDEDTIGFEMPKLKSVDIDDYEDWVIAEALMRYEKRT